MIICPGTFVLTVTYLSLMIVSHSISDIIVLIIWQRVVRHGETYIVIIALIFNSFEFIKAFYLPVHVFMWFKTITIGISFFRFAAISLI